MIQINNYIVYVHTNKINGKRYFGITKQSLSKRFKNGEGYKHSSHFYNAIQKYGWDNFDHEIIASGLSKEEAQNIEIELIQKHNTQDKQFGYNISRGGEWHEYSDEAKERVSKLFMGPGNPNYGHRLSEEQRKELSLRRRGVNAPGYGKEISDEKRKKISASHTGETRSKEMRNQISHTLKEHYKNGAGFTGFGRPAKKILCVENNEIYNSIAEAARQLGIKNKSGISAAANGKMRTCGGYHWEYYEPSVS